jgi:hypothetical protein
MSAGSFNTVLLPSSNISATGTTSTIQGVPGTRGAMFFFNVSAKTGNVSMVLDLEVYDPASGLYVVMYTTSSITTTGMRTYLVYPAASGAVAQCLPAGWRWKWTVTGGDSRDYFTMSASVSFLA